MRQAHASRVTSRQLINAVNQMPLGEVLSRIDALKERRRSAPIWGVKFLLYERAVELFRARLHALN